MSEGLYTKKENCCGCSACYSVCPVEAITMLPDEEGFLYPSVNQDLCINCKKCEQVCPIKAQVQDSYPVHIFAAKNKKEDVRWKSSSGGVFSLIAEYMEAQGGSIYGAAFGSGFAVQHMRAETKEEWQKFCTSKYVQSDLKDIFSLVKADLQKGKRVLFTGTPCQADGLRKYLAESRTDSSKLAVCDIVCHGVPSPKVWRDWIEYVETEYKQKIQSISFRDKEEAGWHNSTLTVKGKENNIILKQTQKENVFFQFFLNHHILRPACFECQYSNLHRPGDMTLGDFWGIEKKYPDVDDDKGVSLVMCSTETGLKIWEAVKDCTDYFEVSREECLQPNLQEPSKRPAGRESFWSFYHSYGLKRTGQKMKLLPANRMDKMVIFACRTVSLLRRM